MYFAVSGALFTLIVIIYPIVYNSGFFSVSVFLFFLSIVYNILVCKLIVTILHSINQHFPSVGFWLLRDDIKSIIIGYVAFPNGTILSSLGILNSSIFALGPLSLFNFG